MLQQHQFTDQLILFAYSAKECLILPSSFLRTYALLFSFPEALRIDGSRADGIQESVLLGPLQLLGNMEELELWLLSGRQNSGGPGSRRTESKHLGAGHRPSDAFM